jgi:branched-chain amino acid transport system ATP-binding protein
VDEVFDLIAAIHAGDLAILLVEQNAYRALNLAHRAYVIENGHIALAGTAAELRGDEAVQRAYLGG